MLSKTHKVTNAIIGISVSGATLCGILWGCYTTLAARGGQTNALKYERLGRADVALFGLKVTGVGASVAGLFKLCLPRRPVRRKSTSRNREHWEVV